MKTHKPPRVINLIKISFVLTLIALLTVGVNVIWGNPEPPRLLNYQGKLTDENGPVTGTVSITFSIYDTPTGGAPLWSEPHDNVTVTDGLFNSILGSLNPIDDSVLSGGERYFELTVNGEPIEPRQQVVSVLFALKAQDAETLSGHPAADFGDGHSLDAADGSPTDVVVVDNGGTMYISAGNGKEARINMYGDVGTAGYSSTMYFYDMQATTLNNEVARIEAGLSNGLGTGDLTFYTKQGNSWVVGLYQRSSNVGIGTTTPEGTLSFSAFESTIPKIRFQNTDANDADAVIDTYDANDGTDLLIASNFQIWTDGSYGRFNTDEETAGIKIGKDGYLRFYTNVAGRYPHQGERITIKPDGNVGIGTTNPETKLHVNGGAMRISDEVYSTTMTQYGGQFTIESYAHLITKTGGGDISFETYSTGYHERLRIKVDGNVGIGTTAPAYKLDVNGIIRGDNVNPSDVRLKKEITPIDNALERVAQLRGVNYEWIDKEKGEGLQMGVIAQEVEAIFPEVVSTDDEGYKSVAYNKLVAVLIEAIKEQQEVIEKQKSELNEMKTKMAKFDEALQKLEALMTNDSE
ncbi:tail fiber domain-containing protein [bacterium]|nr:tail fiber domain-containing protein [bacterium]